MSAGPALPGPKHPGAKTASTAVAEFAEVAVPVPLRRSFTYRIPEALRDQIEVGTMVQVSFGRRKTTGFVVALKNSADVPGLKDIAGVPDPELSIDPAVLQLCRWVAEYYLAPLGEVLRAALPAGLGKKSPGEVPRAAGTVSEICLEAQQENALTAIKDAVGEHTHRAFLLHGVTGSGKTEVYLRAAEAAVEAGGKALILIPEIALSPQMVRRVEARFGNRVALWHSALTPSKRRAVWTRARRGEIDVLVGARSAIFAPIPDLRLIVVDEEHESAYKQADSPRYHARDVALVRAQQAGATVVLGSATPSLESYSNAERGKYTLLSLPHRVERREKGRVELAPLPHPAARRPRSAGTGDGETRAPISFILGDPLREAMNETLARQEQCILFLNRRGHSTVVQCESCRENLGCSQCDIVLTWHSSGNRMVCHYCGRRRTTPQHCPECGGPMSIFKGVGTQRVEAELHRLYAGVRVLRLDTDSTRKRGALESALETFRQGEADVLLGTQMVAKGLDFPRVTLVGVINADLQLALPDFRSAERTFQLLTQVAGRSGRGERPGRVFFQTNHPDHYALTAAADQNFASFYREEMDERREPAYPPYVRLVNLLFDGKDELQVVDEAKRAAAMLEKPLRAAASDHALGSTGPAPREVDVLGPAPQPLSRLKGKYRWHLTLRGRDHRALRTLAEAVLSRHEEKPGPVRVAVDVDPVSML